MKSFRDTLNESKTILPDVGELVEFEEDIETKISGKKTIIPAGTEVEVIGKTDSQIELKYGKIEFYLTAGEFKAYGGSLV